MSGVLVSRSIGVGSALAAAALALGCGSEVPGEGDAASPPGASAGSGGVNASGGASGSANAGRGAMNAGAAGSNSAGRGQSAAAYESAARRLSRAELDNVLEDVLGDARRRAATLLLEDEYAPYDNDYTLQSASRALIDGLNALAEDVAANALRDATRRAALVPCDPSGPGDAACFRQTAETIGAKLFRRPLTDAEIERYLTLLAFATEDNPYVENDFYTAVELFLRAVLQDPEFLYRIEVGAPTSTPGVFALDGYEIATRLAFLVAGTTPDGELTEAAGTGALLDGAARRAQAERLLQGERARAQLHRYHAMWLGYRAIPHGEALTSAFNRETSALIDRVVLEESRDYLELFTFPETYLDASLAEHYGLPPPSGSRGWVSYGASGRAGILSHGSVLSAFSKFSDTSPTQRGIFVQTRLLCNDIAPPPANVNVDQPPGDDMSACKTERYAEHRAIASCASCHDQVDPIGLGLEQYDVAGRFREHDDGAPDCALDGQGELPGHGAFSGPGELGARLAASGELEACAVRQYVAFAIGRRPSAAEASRVDAVIQRFQAGDRDFKELILEFVADPAFALRSEPAP